MRLSVIIPYCYGGDDLRLAALHSTFESISAQDMREYEVIVVEQLVKTSEPTFPYRDKVNKFITLKDPQQRWYNKSWCINVAARVAESERMLMLDADVLFGKDYFNRILEFSKKHIFFYGYDWIALMPGRDNPIIRIKPHSELHAAGGSWSSTRAFYWKILMGCNENYFGYGWEDQDIHIRARHVLNAPIPEIDYPIIHQYHHWHPATGANPWVDQSGGITFSTLKLEPQIIIDRLKTVVLGRVEEPTLIDGTTPRNFRESNLRWTNMEIVRQQQIKDAARLRNQ